MWYLALTAAALIAVNGCENPFSPKGPFQDRLVVYSILSPGSTIQYVRVFTTYNPPGFNPLESTSSNQIANASVSISSGGSVIAFRDTVLPRTELGRYQDSIRAYVAFPVNLVRGAVYTLTVSAPSYDTVTATMTIPDQGFLDIANKPAVTDPVKVPEDITINAIPKEEEQGHVVRLFLEYEIAANPGVFLTEEVPALITNYKDCTTFDATYPEIRRKQAGNIRETWTFPQQNYQRAILKVLKEHEPQVVNFHRVFATMTQADQNLYSYLSLVNGFNDQFSIRVDRPNFTNIRGGFGLFGSFTIDSTSVSVPAFFQGLSCPQ